MAEVKMTDPVADQLRQQLPSNSIMSSPQQQREKVQPVVKNKPTLQKESLGNKVKKMFLPGDMKDVRKYAIEQILVPSIKNGLLALTELALFGTVSGRVRSNNSSCRNYSYISTGSQSMSVKPSFNRQDRATHNFQNITFKTYEDAEDVVSTLLDLVDRYGSARVSDFYDAAGIDSDWASVDWGWTTFQRLEPRAIPGGYVIDISQPVLLKR